MIVTTTPNIESDRIADYHGIVVREAILGANIMRDLNAGTDILGGRSGVNEQEFGRARRTAMVELEERAGELGANAIAGVDPDCEAIDNKLMVSASGTTVTIA